jgi:hypothetical protein
MTDTLDRKKIEADLRNELSTCLTSHWKYCLAGTLGGIPIGLLMKGSTVVKSIPFIIGGLAGTVADWKTAEVECIEYQNRLTKHLQNQISEE